MALAISTSIRFVGKVRTPVKYSYAISVSYSTYRLLKSLNLKQQHPNELMCLANQIQQHVHILLSDNALGLMRPLMQGRQAAVFSMKLLFHVHIRHYCALVKSNRGKWMRQQLLLRHLQRSIGLLKLAASSQAMSDTLTSLEHFIFREGLERGPYVLNKGSLHNSAFLRTCIILSPTSIITTSLLILAKYLFLILTIYIPYQLFWTTLLAPSTFQETYFESSQQGQYEFHACIHFPNKQSLLLHGINDWFLCFAFCNYLFLFRYCYRHVLKFIAMVAISYIFYGNANALVCLNNKLLIKSNFDWTKYCVEEGGWELMFGCCILVPRLETFLNLPPASFFCVFWFLRLFFAPTWNNIRGLSLKVLHSDTAHFLSFLHFFSIYRLHFYTSRRFYTHHWTIYSAFTEQTCFRLIHSIPSHHLRHRDESWWNRHHRPRTINIGRRPLLLALLARRHPTLIPLPQPRHLVTVDVKTSGIIG